MSISSKLGMLNNTKQNLKNALGLDDSVPFADYPNYIPIPKIEWSPSELFRDGQKGFFYEPSSLYQDTAGTIPATANNDPIGKLTDQSGNNNHALQSISAKRMVYKQSPPRIFMDKVDDEFIVVIPTGGWVGEMVIATDIGTACYGVSLPAGNYLLGGRYFPSSAFMGIVFRQGMFTEAEKSALESYFVSKHAVDSYINSISLVSAWRDFKTLTTFPLINTSSGTSFSYAWQSCTRLTSFPLINTSSATNLSSAWYNCTSLTSFPLIDTSRTTDIGGSWYNCTSLTSFPLIDTSSATYLSSAWYGCRSLTSFPLINTASATNLYFTWYGCTSLTSFPLINTASATNLSYAWYGCTSLTNFPLNAFDSIKGGDLTSAFTYTNLNQESIDGILVSLVTSGVATGTRIFNQSGGSAPSSVGRAAIDTLRSRGWTVTVTGGY